MILVIDQLSSIESNSNIGNHDKLYLSRISFINVVIDEYYQQNLYDNDRLYSILLLQCVALVLNHKSNDKSLVSYIFNKYILNEHLHNNNILTVDTFVDFIKNGYDSTFIDTVVENNTENIWWCDFDDTKSLKQVILAIICGSNQMLFVLWIRIITIHQLLIN